MVNVKKADWVSYGYYISMGGLILVSLLSILRSHYGEKISSVGQELARFSRERSERDLEILPPDNLATLPESFRLHLRTELPDPSVEELTQTQAWSTLQKEISTYAQGLDLLRRQMTDLQMHQIQLTNSMTRETYWVSGFGFIATIAVVAFGVLDWQRRPGNGEPGPSGHDSRDAPRR